MGDRLSGARMLIRVAGNISRFPQHIVEILTTTVVQCQKVGLTQSAYEYAAMLMRPEYRDRIDPKYRDRIQKIVIKTDRSAEEPEEPCTPCPVCEFELAETQLDCPSCKNTLPYCIATGRHMTLADWAWCPNCRFPALGGPFQAMLGSVGSCPMCSAALAPEDVIIEEHPSDAMRAILEEGAAGN